MTCEPFINKGTGEIEWFQTKKGNWRCPGYPSLDYYLDGTQLGKDGSVWTPYADFEREKLKELGGKSFYVDASRGYFWHNGRDCHTSKDLIDYSGKDYHNDSESNRLLKRAEFLRAVCKKEGLQYLQEGFTIDGKGVDKEYPRELMRDDEGNMPPVDKEECLCQSKGFMGVDICTCKCCEHAPDMGNSMFSTRGKKKELIDKRRKQKEEMICEHEWNRGTIFMWCRKCGERDREFEKKYCENNPRYEGKQKEENEQLLWKEEGGKLIPVERDYYKKEEIDERMKDLFQHLGFTFNGFKQEKKSYKDCGGVMGYWDKCVEAGLFSSHFSMTCMVWFQSVRGFHRYPTPHMDRARGLGFVLQLNPFSIPQESLHFPHSAQQKCSGRSHSSFSQPITFSATASISSSFGRVE